MDLNSTAQGYRITLEHRYITIHKKIKQMRKMGPSIFYDDKKTKTLKNSNLEMIGWDWSLRLPLSGAHKMGMLGISAAEKQKRKGISDSQFEESRSNLGLYELVRGNKNQPEPSPFLRIKPFLRFGKGLQSPHPIISHNLPFHTYLQCKQFPARRYLGKFTPIFTPWQNLRIAN